MKIAFVISSLQSGGAERALSTLVNIWSEKFNDYLTIYKFDSVESSYFINDKIQIKQIENKPIFKGKFRTLNYTFKTIKILKNEFNANRYDVIISFMPYTNCVCTLVARKAASPILISVRVDPIGFEEHKLITILCKIIYRKASGCVLQTERIKNSFKKIGVRLPELQFIIPNAISEIFIKNEIRWDLKEKILLSVGRLTDQKGHDQLIKAFSRVLKTNGHDNWNLLIAGDGPNKNALIKLAYDSGISNKVNFIGIKRNIEYYYQRASIFILPSKAEGFPNALCEAMAMGCACISYDCPSGPSDIIKNGINGFLIPLGSIDGIVESLKCLMTNSILRNQIALNGLQIREKLSPENILLKWKDAIDLVINERL